MSSWFDAIFGIHIHQILFQWLLFYSFITWSKLQYYIYIYVYKAPFTIGARALYNTLQSDSLAAHDMSCICCMCFSGHIKLPQKDSNETLIVLKGSRLLFWCSSMYQGLTGNQCMNEFYIL